MLGFPPPYSEELLYSVIARAGVHDGETSPKQLLDQVFSNRKVIATVDLPSHVQAVADQYPNKSDLGTQYLIKRHTLWPLFAPFLPSERVNQISEWMANRSQGAAYLASGFAPSRIRAKNRFFVCPDCLTEQLSTHGECYWNRLWQIPLVKVCLLHGALHDTNIKFAGEHRHAFIAVEEVEILNAESITPKDRVFVEQVEQLLQSESEGISFDQWTLFYKLFAYEQKLLNGYRVNHEKIHNTVLHYWGEHWLESANLLPSTTDASWLREMFRKHRKSFSFAEHIVAITALSNRSVNISDVIIKASSIATGQNVITEHQNLSLSFTPSNKLNSDQVQWQQLLPCYPPSAARKQNPALYARLYRYHHNWLLYINTLYQDKRLPILVSTLKCDKNN